MNTMQFAAQYMNVAFRFLLCVVSATVYQVATNPHTLALVLAITGYWQAGLWLVAAWHLLCAVAVLVSRDRHSDIAGGPVFTTPDWLLLLGNAQEGNAPDW
jgi:hypothetical protein